MATRKSARAPEPPRAAPAGFTGQSWLARAWPLLLVAVVATLPYWQTTTFPFLAWDDDQHIYANPWLLAGTWTRFWTTPYDGLYVPLPYTLWTMLHALTPQPWLFHAANVVLHGINSALVAAFCVQLVRDDRGKAAAADWWPALVAGLLFGLHPLQVESVAWVAGLRDLSCACFALLAMLAYARAASWRSRTYLWATLAFIASLLCKPTAAVVPAALLISDGLLRRRPIKTALAGLLPWCVLALPFVIATAQIQRETIGTSYDKLPIALRAFLACDTLGFYLGKLVFPADLATDYGRLPQLVLARLSSPVAAICGLVAVLALLVAALRYRRGGALAGAAFFAVFLLPTSGIIPFAFQRISSVADRYMYLPLIGVALAAAALVPRLPRAGRYTAVALAGLLGGLATQRTATWASDKALYSAMLAANPISFSANSGLGTLALDSGDYAVALGYYDKALAVEPSNVLALANAGLALDRLGREREVLERIAPLIPDARTISRSPLSAKGIARLFAVIGYAHARVTSAEAGLDFYCRASALDPQDRGYLDNISALNQQLQRAGRPAPTSCQDILRQ